MLPLFNTNVVNDSNFVVNYHGDYKYSCKNRNRRINPTVPALSPSYFTTEHVAVAIIAAVVIISVIAAAVSQKDINDED